MREFRIKVNNEKTYVVKANDYNQAVKTLHSKLRDDNTVSDSIGKYTGEDAIKTNGFVRIKEDGDWTSYKYNGSSDFDDAVFKIYQYNPSLIAFVSHGNKTITVRKKYLNDSADTAQGEIEVLKSFGFDYKDGKWVKESNSNDIIVQPDYHSVSVIGPGDTEKHCKKYQYQSAGMLKKIIASNIKDSSIKDDLTQVETYKKSIIYIDDNGYYYHTPIGGRGAKAQKDNTKDINIVKKRIDNDYSFLYDSSIKDAGEEIRYLEGMKFNGIPYTGWAVQHWTDGYYTFDGKKPYIPSGGRDALLSIFKQGGFIGQWKGIKPDKGFESYFRHSTAVPAKDKLIESGSKEALSKNIATEIKAGKDPKQAAAIAYSVQRENDASIKDVDWDFANKLKQHSQEEIRNALKYSAPTVYKQYKNGETIQYAGLAGQLTGPEKTKVLKCLGDSNITDADPVKVEKIIRKEKSALDITYYLFQTKSNSGATIYYEVTDKTYHGEPTYSGGGVISFSLQSANDSLDRHLLSDKLKAKYGEKEGTKRYLRGENDSAIKDAWSGVRSNGVIFHYSDGKYTITHKNGKVETIPGNRFNTTEELFKYIDNIKDSANNIKNRKSYTIKVGDKQYKIFAESEEEAINKYIKSKKQ